jgi:uncharacterized membrane protein YcaP (DUF421 family)
MMEVFALTTPLWEIALRATAVYFAVFLLLRLVPTRTTGRFSLADVLVLIIIGSMAKSGIVADSKSVGDIVLMIALVLIWDYVLNLLEYNVPFLQFFLRDRQTALIQDGRLLRGNMRREMVTEDELLAALRKKGVTDVSTVSSAYLEADGDISLIKKRRPRR